VYLSKSLHVVRWEGDKYGQMTLSKIIKIVATRYRILRLKCTRWGAYSAPPDLLAGIKGTYF